ncbi:MAG: glucuronate isomerase [Turicibacter sp.]|nr:glucuronate isomerase [Turicibacter sp.]
MKKFLDQDFMLHSEAAKFLYHNYAKEMPIIDFHNHLSAQEIYENKQFDNITDVWLGGDHYKWRAMRTLGVKEEYITGNANKEEKFLAWANSVPYLIGSPLYHWTHMELQRYFNIPLLLNKQNAKKIYEQINEKLQEPEFRVRGLLQMQKVQVVGTTDDPVDDLKWHRLIREEESIDLKVVPTFRPDKAVNIENAGFAQWVEQLATVVGFEIKDIDHLLKALTLRMEFFKGVGAMASDNGIDVLSYDPLATLEEAGTVFVAMREGIPQTENQIRKYKSVLLDYLGREYNRMGWVMQLHIGALRNNNSRKLAELGPDTGFDAINDSFSIRMLGAYLNKLDATNELPKTIIYDLNPADNHKVVTLMQCFQDGEIPGKIQFGSGWWFMDQKDGMIDQMRSLAANGILSQFVGMLTDSRSFLSFPRHEYFRRILSNLFGEYVEMGEFPGDMNFLGGIIQNICYHNPNAYFGFGVNEEMSK